MLSHETIWLFQLVHVAAAVFSFISACMGLTRYLNILDVIIDLGFGIHLLKKGQVGYSMEHHERAFHNYYIQCPWKYSGQHNQCNTRVVHDGKVRCNTVNYTTAFLYSSWLYFTLNMFILLSRFLFAPQSSSSIALITSFCWL